MLIEVRKPGRPLSACPHPVGSCSCERVVINYTVPKSSECPCPTSTSTVPAVATARIQKSRVRKPSITPSNLQKVIESNPTVPVQSATRRIESGPTVLSDTSSNGPSIPSSTSSTPRIDPVDGHPVNQPGKPFSSHATKVESQRPNAPSGMIGAGGYGAPKGTIGFTGDRKDSDGHTQSAPTHQLQETTSGCSASKMQPPHGSNSNVQQNLSEPQPSCYNSSQVEGLLNLGTNITDPFAISDVSMDQFSFPTWMDSSGGQQGHVFATSSSVEPQISNSLADHGCRCGDSCACIGCAAHPRNQRMIEYVRYHNELAMRMEQKRSQLSMLMNGPFQQALPLVHGGPHSFDNLNGMAFTNNMPQSQYSPPLGPMHAMDPAYSMAFIGGASWALENFIQNFNPSSWVELENAHLHNNSNHGMIAPNGINGFYGPDGETQHILNAQHPPENIRPDIPTGNNGESQHSLYQHHADEALMHPSRVSESQPNILDAESPEDDESILTLSPSSFLPLSVTLEGCDGGACRCGNGCQCPGCPLHNGGETGDDDTETKARSNSRVEVTETRIQGDVDEDVSSLPPESTKLQIS